MNRLFSTRINNGAFNMAMLFLRLVTGGLMLHHGYQKLVGFNQMKGSFMNFLHLGSTVTLALVVFAEFFCSAFVILGLFTRLACIVLIINLIVIIFIVSHMDFFGKAEVASLYLVGFLAILLCGAGKASVDNMISK